MMLDSDIAITQQNEQLIKRYKDVEEAVRFALTEIGLQYRVAGQHHVWLRFHFKRQSHIAITPGVEIVTGDSFNPATIELDMLDIIRQIEDRFRREHVTWDELEIDVYKDYNIRHNVKARSPR